MAGLVLLGLGFWALLGGDVRMSMVFVAPGVFLLSGSIRLMMGHPSGHNILSVGVLLGMIVCVLVAMFSFLLAEAGGDFAFRMTFLFSALSLISAAMLFALRSASVTRYIVDLKMTLLDLVE